MIAEIIAQAARAFDVTPAEILGQSRHARCVRPRQAVAYVLKARGKLSLGDIAHHLRRRDHSTIIHAVKVAGLRMEADPSYRATVEALIALTPATYIPPVKARRTWKKAPAVPKPDTDIAEHTRYCAGMVAGSRALLAALAA